jgi:beta-galactosidase
MTGGKDEFYRAPTGIDEGTHESDYDDIWRAEGLDRLKKKVQSVSAVSAGNQVLLEVQASYTAEPDNAVLFTAHTLYRIGSEGMELKNEVTNNSGLETIARVGQSFCLPAAFDTLSWYGKGSWETYADRKDAAFTGFYTSSVAEQYCSVTSSLSNSAINDLTSKGTFILTELHSLALMVNTLAACHSLL